MRPKVGMRVAVLRFGSGTAVVVMVSCESRRAEYSLAMSPADRIWNRAALERGGPSPRAGDRALAALLLVHGLVMNGGVLHAIEHLSSREVNEALDGFRFFDLHGPAEVLAQALATDVAACSDETELALDAVYGSQVPNDDTIVKCFEAHFRVHPESYAPAPTTS